jgi:hypothetical protein
MISDNQTHLRRRPGEVRDTNAMNARARTVLGKKQYVSLEDWIKKELESENEN